jgi:hypothetical protein
VAHTGLTLGDLFRWRAIAGQNKQVTPKSLLVVWLHGGASHLETYDPKPLAPSEIRGPFGPIDTSVPGLQISELLPRQAKIAHQFTVVRSLVHTGFCHDDGPQQIFTGHPLQGRRLRPDHPDLFVEAGVQLVTTTLNGSLCGRTGSWDDHAVNHHVFEAMRSRAPFFDQAVSALIEDLHERGLD